MEGWWYGFSGVGAFDGCRVSRHPGYFWVMGTGHRKGRRRRKTAVARELRRRATAAEQRAWTLLRNRGVLGVNFRRQKVIRGFIVDFYCADLNLVLEIDGPIHEAPEQHDYDVERDALLRRLGFTVVRLVNADVGLSRLETVVAQVLESRGRLPPLPAACARRVCSPSPVCGRGGQGVGQGVRAELRVGLRLVLGGFVPPLPCAGEGGRG